jgi:hypothetical protein
MPADRPANWDARPSARHTRRGISGIYANGCNAADGRKDKKDGGFIFSGTLTSQHLMLQMERWFNKHSPNKLNRQ